MPRSATNRMWESASPYWSRNDRDICCVMILPSADLLSAKPRKAPRTGCTVLLTGAPPERTVGCAAGSPTVLSTGCRHIVDQCCRIRYQHVCSYPSIVSANEELTGSPKTKSDKRDCPDQPRCHKSALQQAHTAANPPNHAYPDIRNDTNTTTSHRTTTQPPQSRMTRHTQNHQTPTNNSPTPPKPPNHAYPDIRNGQNTAGGTQQTKHSRRDDSSINLDTHNRLSRDTQVDP